MDLHDPQYVFPTTSLAPPFWNQRNAPLFPVEILVDLLSHSASMVMDSLLASADFCVKDTRDSLTFPLITSTESRFCSVTLNVQSRTSGRQSLSVRTPVAQSVPLLLRTTSV